MKPARRPFVIGTAAVLLIGSFLLIRARALPARADAPEPAVGTAIPVAAETAVLTTVPQCLDATGTVHAELEAPIATKVQGRVLSVAVREGDRVHRGQLLIRLDARDLDAAVSQAQAGVRSASVGFQNSRVAASMEAGLAAARISQAQAAVSNAEAALQAARARAEMVQAGPRRQEKTQAGLAVVQAQSTVTLAQKNLARMNALFDDGAISHQQLDTYQSQYDVAKAQLDTAREAQSIAEEGSRSEDVRAAQEAVRQAAAGLTQAKAGLAQARAAARQAEVKRAEISSAQAQVGQGRAALEAASVMRDYATITAPFDGIVTKRSVDPGALASPGVPLLTIQGGSLQLEAVVPEGNLRSVRLGSRLPVVLDALSGLPVGGRVAEIAPQGDPASHTFLVKVNLPGRSGERAGMFGRAKIATGSTRAILVPASALTLREGLSYLYVVDNTEHARLRLVTVGGRVGDRVSVLSGLGNGGRFIVNPQGVKDGALVTEGGQSR